MIVMKFGGTSVKDAVAIERVCEIVRGRLEKRPVVVVSAMSKVTDSLLACSAAAGKGQRAEALRISAELRERHLLTANDLVGEHSAVVTLHPTINAEFDALDDLLKGICAVGELTERTKDSVVGYGERLSSTLCAACFAKNGLDSALVDARQVMITDKDFGKAKPLVEEIDRQAMLVLKPLLEAAKVPVMGGFVGATHEGVPTTIGRGGSDFSAALFGAALDAEAIEIWTDVNGMMTTDPRIVDEARRIRIVSFEEAAELAYFGAKVLHPATVLPAVAKDIPVLVLNSHNPVNEGTRIVSRAPRTSNPFMAIAVKKSITIVDVTAARMLGEHGYLQAIFEIFGKHHAAVDVVSTSEVSVSLTIDSNQAIPALAEDLQEIADVKYEGRKAIICLVGENIRETPGIAGRVFSAVGDIKVRMISLGASEINITFVVEEDDAAECVRRLHKEFFTELDPKVFD